MSEEVHCGLYVDGDPSKPCGWQFVGTSRANAMQALIHHQRERHSLQPTEEEWKRLQPQRQE